MRAAIETAVRRRTADGGKSWRTQQETLIGAEGVFDALDIPSFFGVHFIDRSNGVAAALERAA